MSQSTALWISVFLLFGNAFFVGAEFAAMAARRSSLEPLAIAGNRRAQLCLEALGSMGGVLATGQLGITVCSVGLGALAESALEASFEPLLHSLGVPDGWAVPLALALSLLIVVYLHVVVGEMIPKNLAISRPDRAALILVPPLLVLSRALRPIIAVMEWIAKGLVRMLGIEPKDELPSTFTAQEVGHILGESHREGLIETDRHGLVRKTLEFSAKVARDVAVPVDALSTVEHGATPADIERLVARKGFSRYLVRDADGDIAGYLHIKDLLYADDARYQQPVPLKRVRRLATVSPTDEVEEVLASMQRTGAHLARVVGPEGSVSGVIFLEDVIEELVGEVTDSSQR